MKIGQYLLISTTFLGLVNPLAVLADNQVDNINSSTILSDKKNIADKTKGTKDSIDESKVQENDEIVTFDDPALESVVRDALNTKKTDSEPLTQSDFSNYTSGNNFISIDMFYSSPENGPTGPTSLKGLEALKYLPSNINISIEIQNMNSDVSLKPLTGLNNLEDLWLGKASFSDEDIDALNSTHWGDKAHVVGLYGKNDSNVYYNAGGITNDQFKALKPYFDDAYKHGSRMFALDNNQIFDFSQFSEYSNLSVQAINQWQELPNPVQVKDGQKVVSFKSQVKGLDGSPITDSVISTSGALTNNNGEYTINDYTTGRIPDTILVQGERSHDNQLLKHIHNYSNGSKLVQSGTELYKIGEPVKAADVTVKYVDENGKNIEDPTIISGNVDDSFETKQKTFEGYTFHDVKGETSGKLDSQPKTVTYTYYKDDGSNHTVNFYDMNGKKIADEISIDGTYKDAYDLTDQVNKVLIDLKKQGYKQVSNYGLIKGNFVQLHDEADYILTKLPANEVGTVKANYVDEQGNVITDSEIKGGKLGSVYKTEKKSIKGYTFKEVQGNETGKITDKEQTVTYIYTKNPEKGADVTVKYVDENGKEIAKSEVKSGNVGDKYT
ncbi:MucBP domain-containing protein, partial [Weissella kandleri]|uniref:MucBP domain-containing protein n=1 Tax=Weissella kandleri TaxID=1616 RepID=UPI00387E70CB